MQTTRVISLSLALLLAAGHPAPAGASKLGDLIKQLRIDEIVKPDAAPAPGTGATGAPAFGEAAEPVARPSGGETAALGEIESLLSAKKWREAVARIEAMSAAGEGGEALPFLAWLRGRILADRLQNREAALAAYREAAERHPGTRYGNAAKESFELLAGNQLTEVALKTQMEALAAEIDALTKELENTSFVRFVRRAELKKKLSERQAAYLAKKDLLENYRESPESLVRREGEGRRIAAPPARAADSKRAVVKKDGYNIRATPWGKILGTLKKGESLEIIGRETVDGKTWYKVKWGGKVGYVFEAGVTVDAAGAPGEEFAEEKQDEFQSGIVRRLAAILHGAGNEDPSELSDEALVSFFMREKELARSFPELVEKRDAKEMREVARGLLRMLHFTPLRRAVGGPLARRDYREAYRIYREKYTENYADPAIFPFDEKAVPTIVINIPAKRLRMYRDGLLVFDVPMVPGQKLYPGETGNTKTRVGRYKLESWHENYTTADYPVRWDDDVWQGAFGKWCAKIGPNGAGQHIHGTRGPKILGNIPINYAPGSHGCIRLANRNIITLHEIAPVGTKVIKTYCLHERVAKRGVFGEGFRTLVYENLYGYDCAKDGFFYPGAGVFIDHVEPPDAVR